MSFAAALRAPGLRAGQGLAFLTAFGVVAVGVGLGRAITTTYVPVLLDRIEDAPGLIALVMLVNAAAGFAVPLVVGLWSDRHRAGRFGRRLPFVVGGTILTCGGLVAVALGTTSSYLVLALAAAAVYLGLNATATAHRAVVVEGFEDSRRPAATSSQEVAMLIGGLAGLGVGAVLIDAAPAVLFLAVAVALPLLAVPTLAILPRLDRRAAAPARRSERSHGLRDFVAAMRERGPREVLFAQILWVAAYAALPTFFLLYAEDSLGLGHGQASLFLLLFGVVSGAAMLLAGRAAPGRVFPLLMLGAGLLGGGLLLSAGGDRAAEVAAPFAVAAVGAGLVTALGFPYFARFVPEGYSGRYSGLYFSVRAIASAVALPLAGLTIELTGSYRALLLQGAAALLAMAPLAAAERRRRPAQAAAAGAPLGRVAAVIPCFGPGPVEQVARETVGYVDEVVVVDDGSPAGSLSEFDDLTASGRLSVVRLERNGGKGDAVAAGVNRLMADAARPDAIVVLDADGQHLPERIPALVEAARSADVVIGRRRRSGAMPWTRRITNAVSSTLLSAVTGRWLPDAQCGMRLYRSELLERVPLPQGRFEAETVHLREAVRADAVIRSVPIPTIYDGAGSTFRPLADTARILRAILAADPDATPGMPTAEFVRTWAVRFGVLVASTCLVVVLVPLLSLLDKQLFLALNGLGTESATFQAVMDPHSRNYVLMSVLAVAVAAVRGPRWMTGAAVAVLAAGILSDVLVQVVYVLYDRARPEEVLGSQALLPDGRHWAHIASFPSGHMVVTTAIAVAAMRLVPVLRAPLWMYVIAIGLTRVSLGAHFPLDVLVGGFFGYQVGLFAAAVPRVSGVLGPSRTKPSDVEWRLPGEQPAIAGGDH